MNPLPNRRILLIDDMPTIHEDFRKILAPASPQRADFDAVEAALFGEAPKAAVDAFQLDSAYQGQEGLAKLEQALAAGLPYAMAFVDMRMPPGWDGVQTIEHLWRVDPRLQVVICTAYSDHSWDEVLARLEVRDRLLVLKKPFDSIEVSQLATALTAKWNATLHADEQRSRLEDAVRDRTAQIMQTNAALHAEVSERKHLQGQLVESGKLASIGQLAAGMAHELNNPIGYVYSNFTALEGYLASLFTTLAAYERAEHDSSVGAAAPKLRAVREQVDIDFLRQDIPLLVHESKQGIERIRQIVQDLRDFSRVDSAQEWALADLHRGIDSTLNLAACNIKDRADVIKEYGTIPDIECLASQINQVVMNLVVNAAQSIGAERGQIILRTGTEGSEVWLEVIDNGSGIGDDTLPRIFEPFFTTRPVGSGTGLGLSQAYGIVQKHGGRIDVTSRPGVGSTFRVTLPTRQPTTPAAAD